MLRRALNLSYNPCKGSISREEFRGWKRLVREAFCPSSPRLANLQRESYFPTQVFNLSRGPMTEAFEPLSNEELQKLDRFLL